MGAIFLPVLPTRSCRYDLSSQDTFREGFEWVKRRFQSFIACKSARVYGDEFDQKLDGTGRGFIGKEFDREGFG